MMSRKTPPVRCLLSPSPVLDLCTHVTCTGHTPLKISVWFVTDITEFSGIHNTLDLTHEQFEN
jgi:hypothetical protein